MDQREQDRSVQTNRQQERRRRRRRLRIMRTAIVLTVLLVIALIVTLLVLRISGAVAKKNGTASPFLSVKAIEIEGETRYTDEEIIAAGGIRVGDSLLVINKVQAHNAILAAFPYLDYVDVGNASFSTIRIRLHETRVIGAVECADMYMMVGENNHALELLPAEQLPPDTVRILGADCPQEELGAPLMDERSRRIAETLLDAVQTSGLTGLTAIDMNEKTNIRMILNDRIDVILGNESNLAAQVKALNAMLPTLYTNNGEKAAGTLDMSSFSDDRSDNDKAIFSPATD